MCIQCRGAGEICEANIKKTDLWAREYLHKHLFVCEARYCVVDAYLRGDGPGDSFKKDLY
jgi:hypothetical protein